MGKHGMKVVKSKTSKQLYDSLDPTAQEIWDEIGSLGYKPEQGAQNLWFARKMKDPDADPLGPAESLGALLSIVKGAIAEGQQAAAAKDDEDSEEGSAPSTRLPGMEEPAIEELDRQADICIEAGTKRKNAVDNEKDQDDIFRDLLRRHGRKRYSRNNWSLSISESEKLVKKKDKGPQTSKRNERKQQPNLPTAA